MWYLKVNSGPAQTRQQAYPERQVGQWPYEQAPARQARADYDYLFC